MCLAVDLHENLVQTPLPIGMSTEILDTVPADLGGEQRAKTVPQETDRLVANIDATFV
jgi:hypothetical protein